MKVPGILKNKYVCYALMALAALNVIGYLTVKAWECLALFVLAGYSAYCYCKDKSCAILAALFVANFVFGCGRVKEGFVDAFKGPMEHLQNAKLSLFRAREGFEATKANCCGIDHKTACEAVMSKCDEASVVVDEAGEKGEKVEEEKNKVPVQPGDTPLKPGAGGAGPAGGAGGAGGADGADGADGAPPSGPGAFSNIF